jgi:CheY-like chemotaxis protein
MGRKKMRRVLVFDDNPEICDIVRRILCEAGYEVRFGTADRHGLHEVTRHDYDVLITDVFMPEMDGMELIRAARQARPELPIICMSGGASYVSADFSLNLSEAFGAKPLSKPFGRRELLAALEEA